MNGNMRIYDAARKVPQEAMRPIQAGRLKGKTDINPMWRLKKLTELYGPCGIGWWYTIDKQWLEPGANGEISAFCDITLYYREGDTVSQGIPGTGGSAYVAKEKSGLFTSDECYKMALTDALSVACKALGIGADVYFDKDKTKYTANDSTPPPPPQKLSHEPEPAPTQEFAGSDLIDQIYQMASAQDIDWFENKYGDEMQFMPARVALKAIAKLKGEA